MAVITPEQQIANVQAVLLGFVRRLYEYWGRSMIEARQLVAARGGYADRRGRRPKWSSDAWAAVAALDHWRQLKAAHAAGTLQPLSIDDESPF